ncbi:hypothetical protein G4B88_023764 [Cannabis sativa]|uniref:Uncharacterized protein n=1 Tax=Cannabis sativa TaxID=3483 RepID=A0A7J6HXN6_CANSA|nr:hypothetical protein G4B88_023764 [Cannabis sativa]
MTSEISGGSTHSSGDNQTQNPQNQNNLPINTQSSHTPPTLPPSSSLVIEHFSSGFPSVNQTIVVKLDGSNYLGWLYASLFDIMLGQIVGFSTTAQIWVSLEQTYTTASFAQKLEVQTTLQNLKKEGMSALAYLQKLKLLYNVLASIGGPVSLQDHHIYLFNGIGSKYNAFVSPIQA